MKVSMSKIIHGVICVLNSLDIHEQQTVQNVQVHLLKFYAARKGGNKETWWINMEHLRYTVKRKNKEKKVCVVCQCM